MPRKADWRDTYQNDDMCPKRRNKQTNNFDDDAVAHRLLFEAA